MNHFDMLVGEGLAPSSLLPGPCGVDKNENQIIPYITKGPGPPGYEK